MANDDEKRERSRIEERQPSGSRFYRLGANGEDGEREREAGHKKGKRGRKRND